MSIYSFEAEWKMPVEIVKSKDKISEKV